MKVDDVFNPNAPAIPDIAEVWSSMWANMDGQPEDEPDRFRLLLGDSPR